MKYTKSEIQCIASGLVSAGSTAENIKNIRQDSGGVLSFVFTEDCAYGSQEKNVSLTPEAVMEARKKAEEKIKKEKKIKQQQKENEARMAALNKKCVAIFGMNIDQLISDVVKKEFGYSVTLINYPQTADELTNPFSVDDGYNKITIGIRDGKIYATDRVTGFDVQGSGYSKQD